MPDSVQHLLGFSFWVLVLCMCEVHIDINTMFLPTCLHSITVGSPGHLCGHYMIYPYFWFCWKLLNYVFGFLSQETLHTFVYQLLETICNWQESCSPNCSVETKHSPIYVFFCFCFLICSVFVPVRGSSVLGILRLWGSAGHSLKLTQQNLSACEVHSIIGKICTVHTPRSSTRSVCVHLACTMSLNSNGTTLNHKLSLNLGFSITGV